MSDPRNLRDRLSAAFEAGSAEAVQPDDAAARPAGPPAVRGPRGRYAIDRIRPYRFGLAVAGFAFLLIFLHWPELMPLASGLAAGTAIGLVLGRAGHGWLEGRKHAALAEANEARLRAERALEDRQRLLATVAHDLRTPLTGLLGMADLLENSRLAAEQRNYVAGLRQSGDMLSYLVEDLLDFATMEAGRFELRRVPESPRRLIETVVEMLASRAHFKGLEIGSFVAPDVPEEVELDPGRLRQVLYNIVGNAVKFTQRGGILVSAAMEGEQLVIAVGDTGPGLSEAEKGLIFGEFVQVGGAESRSGGKGLGLSITARIVQAFGGRLTVESTKGEGSTFTIRLPIARAAETGAIPEREEALAGSAVLLFAPAGPAARAVEQTIAALGGSCVLCPEPRMAAAVLAEGHLDGRPLTDIIVDHRLGRHYIGDLAQRAEAMNLRRVFLVNPEERQGRISGPYDAWLIRPLRERSLIDVLKGRLRGLERRGATNDNLPHDAEAGRRGGIRVRQRLVLLGEDDPVNTLLVRTALERAGIAVLSSGDFSSLVSEIGRQDQVIPDLIITDLNMPGGTIDDVFLALDQHHLKPVIPVLVLSGERDPGLRSGLLGKGAAEVLAKPIMPADLLRHVDALAPPPGPPLDRLDPLDSLFSERTLH